MGVKVIREPHEAGFRGGALERVREHLDGYVASRRFAGWLVTVARDGDVVWVSSGGHRDREQALPVTEDTIWRIYSMTKPITVVAALQLYEEGRFELNDPVGAWIEEFADARVYVSGTATAPVTEPVTEPVRVHHLMTHTSGLTYGFQNLTPVDAMYRALGYEMTNPAGVDLTRAVHEWASTPLLFQPGTSWNYSVSIDVLGRLIELWTGQSLDVVVRQRVLEPLGMVDTDWYCASDKLDRLAMLYAAHHGDSVRLDELATEATRWPSLLAGGGGLVSTAADYHRFMSMLLGGGQLEGVRVLSPRTVALMTQNHLPGNADLRGFARDSFSEVGQAGVGFGLGVSVVVDQIRNRSYVPAGTFAWGGAASTYFWVDPSEGLTVGLYTQLLPSWTYPVRRQVQQLVYAALER